MTPIAYIHTDFKEKFGIPRQSGLISECKGKIVFKKEYSVPEAFRGLEDFSHIWVLWEFSESKRDTWSPTVRPPLLGGNKRMGVFATRSPFRPNSIGLSALRLDKVDTDARDGVTLHVSGADMLDGTPVFDIKPYLPYTDSIPHATGGFTESLGERKLEVSFPDELLKRVPEKKRSSLMAVLEGDPRPSYQDDPERVYGMKFSEFEVKFRVEGGRLQVTSLRMNNEK